MVNGASGVHDVTEMWNDHFEKLYLSSETSEFRAVFDDKLKILSLVTTAH